MPHNKAPTVNFKPGDKVQIWISGGQWRDAIIIRFAAYGGGYDYQYDPLPQRVNAYDPLPSVGGWTCDKFCRAR